MVMVYFCFEEMMFEVLNITLHPLSKFMLVWSEVQSCILLRYEGVGVEASVTEMGGRGKCNRARLEARVFEMWRICS